MAQIDENVHSETMFKDLNADDDDQAPMEIESYCMNCHENVSIFVQISLDYFCILGYNKTNVYTYSVLQTSHRDVFLL